MNIRTLTILFMVFCFSCSIDSHEGSEYKTTVDEVDMPFDSERWNKKDGDKYLFRKNMLNNVIYNDTLRYLDRNEIMDMLGEPNRENENYLYYTIDQKKIWMWPIHTKTLVIKFTEDSSIEWMKIHE